jgi:hypothetical protein
LARFSFSMVLVSIVKQTRSRPGESGLKDDRSSCGDAPSGRAVMVSGTSGFGASPFRVVSELLN